MNSHSKFAEFMKYSAFNIMGMLGLSCYILADTYFVSKGLGTKGLTALNLAIPVYSFIHGSGLMLGMGGATRYSVFRERKAGQGVDGIFMNTVYLSVAISMLFLLTGVFFSDGLTVLLGADAEVEVMTKTYLKVILLFAPAFMMNDVLVCFVRNDKNPRLSMISMLVGSLCNIVLDYVFIFPLGMGILGAVLATGAAPVISMLLLSLHWKKKKNGIHFKWQKPELSDMFSGIPLGFPSLVAEVSSGIVMIVYNIILLKIAQNTGVAAYGVVANLSLVVMAVYTGLAQGMQPVISSDFGRRDAKSIRKVVRYGMTVMLILSAVIYLTMCGFASEIAGIFNSGNDAGLQSMAVQGIRLYFTAVPFAGFNIVIAAVFTSTQKVIPAHLISLLRGFILIIPLAVLLSRLWGIYGIWLTFPVTEGIAAVLGIVIYMKKKSGELLCAKEDK